MSIWKEDKYNLPEEKTYQFFEQLRKTKKDLDTKVNGIIYRDSQKKYAIDIMQAIRDKRVLLVEAGVGIGKSFGYLIPIFQTLDNVDTFNKVVISTSSIALQEQLIGDINKISEMLGIDVKVNIAKGINNYACLNRIKRLEEKDDTSDEKKETLNNLVDRMEQLSSSDKEDLKDISNVVWNEVNLQSRGKCSKCSYAKGCYYLKHQNKLPNSNIIVTNHANFIKDINEDGRVTEKADMFVIDEAHQLEGNIREHNKGTLDLYDIKKTINRVCINLDTYQRNNEVFSTEEEISYPENLKREIEQLFSAIRRNASLNFSKNKKTDDEITDCSRLPFTYTRKIRDILENILRDLDKLTREISLYERKYSVVIRTNSVRKLAEIKATFKDMARINNSINIYWVEFYKNNKIIIDYTPKRNLGIANSMLNKKIPAIFTSGTLTDNKNSYNYFMNGINLEGNKYQTITLGASYPSPYDYENNTLMYFNPDISVPNDYNNYVIDLAKEIDKLIKATNGKALVLFTSKKCMNDCYKILASKNYDFPLLLQSNNNATEIKQKFQDDTDSCLFATGAFWEGVDIKGKSLSNLIITHLPFDVVDAVSQYKASRYARDTEKFSEVYIPSMLTKFTQAAGRLIRSGTDTGVISCLDPRFSKYQNLICNKTGMTNCTKDINDVIRFADEKILNTAKGRK